MGCEQKKAGTKMVPPNQAPSKSHCKTLNLRRLDPEILVLVPEQNRTYMYQNWMVDNSMCQNFIYPILRVPNPSPASCWSGTEGSVVITKRYLKTRSTTHFRRFCGHPTEAPRDGLEGMEFVPPQRLNQKKIGFKEQLTIYGKT